MLYSSNDKSININPNNCHGCALCTLVCPVWQQNSDVRYTPHGLAKTLQAGGKLESSAVMNCILCCACATICPQDIDLVDFMMELRKNANTDKTPSALTSKISADSDYTGKTVLITSSELQNNQPIFKRTLDCLKSSGPVQIASDLAEDIINGFESGNQASQQRLNQFVEPLRKAKKIIVSNGLLQHKLQSWLPEVNIISIGLAMSSQNSVRHNLTETDFYVIDSRAFNTNQQQSLTHYHDLHNSCGCEFNLDLHRLAIPTGNYINNTHNNNFDLASQAQWLISGRTFDRIIVEDIKDYELLPGITDKPVIHISELAL